jgi:lysine biosynthesis protein LysW
MASRNKAACPDCGEEITLHGKVELGMEVICPHCEAELEVVETVPVELDWIYEDDEDHSYEEEEEEEEDW